jgi:hypothetical protein
VHGVDGSLADEEGARLKNRDDVTVLCGSCIDAVFGKKEVESLTIGLVVGACSRCGVKLAATDRYGHFRVSVVRAAVVAKNATPLPEIALVPVTSSNVAAVGYDEATKTARVRFHNGAVYRYADVPKELHESIMAAPSVGKAVVALRKFPTTREP